MPGSSGPSRTSLPSGSLCLLSPKEGIQDKPGPTMAREHPGHLSDDGPAEGRARLATSHGAEERPPPLDTQHGRLSFQKQKTGWEGRGRPGDVLTSRHLRQHVPSVVRGGHHGPGPVSGLPPSAGSLAPKPGLLAHCLRGPRSQGPKCITSSLLTVLERFHIRCTREVSENPNAHP